MSTAIKTRPASDHQAISGDCHHVALMSLYEATTRGDGMGRLRACRRELDRALPLLVEHTGDEEEALRFLDLLRGRADAVRFEVIVSENLARLRELRAVREALCHLEQRCLAEDDPAPTATETEAITIYLRACIEDLLTHETAHCPVPEAAAVTHCG